jgi:hypothetical protein
LVGNVGGASLSTTTTIYLTANTLDASLYVAGTTILFADASGVYHFGTILSNTSDVLSLTQASTGTPADQTPIYSLGKMIANEVWNADNTTYNTEHTYGEDLGGINLSLITAAANAIWDEDLGDHIVKNSFGSVVQDDLAGLVTSVALIPQSGSTVSWNSTALGAIADAVWDELINAGHSTANSAGKICWIRKSGR